MTQPVFQCRMCGICCAGQGGIVLGPRDMQRICAHLGVTEPVFMERYGYTSNGKAMIRTGVDGYCVFFVAGRGCIVHDGKPDVCRAWPYFRGNLTDAHSFAMAKDYCAGLRRDATHEEFVREGEAYLREHNLFASDASREGTALMPAGALNT